jgi:hypothetical protein
MPGGRARDLMDAALAKRRAWQRKPIATTAQPSSEPTIYFLTPDWESASGGVRLMYRHVDELNAAGIKAAALHHKPGFRYEWFDNDTVVTDEKSTAVSVNDVLVVPEMDVDRVAMTSQRIKHIVLNQSGHLTWRRFGDVTAEHLRTTRDLLGIICVSEHSREFLDYTFPDVRVRRIRGAVDADLFNLGESTQRERVVGYLPRRGGGDTELVTRMLASHGLADGWRLDRIDGLGQRAFAERLRQCRIILSLSYQEGFGLPAAESMACGAYVVGFHGFGGREFFRPEFSSPVETGDVLAAARAVERAIASDDAEGDWCSERGRLASSFILSTYSVANETSDVLRVYPELAHS